MEHVVTLETLAGGAASERFGIELEKLLANVADPNTKADAVREIRMSLKVKPDIGRSSVAMSLEVSSKLAPYQAVATHGWIGKRQGQPALVENDPRQLGLELENPTSSTIQPKEQQ